MKLEKILIVNDDGIESPVLPATIKALSQYFKVWVMVPDQERSTIGHGLTVHKPLRVKEVSPAHFPEAQKVWKANGKPADCVKLALRHFAPDIDLVFSGINLGSNLGMDTLYSGTVAGAMEAVLEGKKGFAASVWTHEPHLNFLPAAEYVARYLAEHYDPRAEVWNMNLPYLPHYDAIELKKTCLGKMEYGDLLQKRTDPRGHDYFWIQGFPLHNHPVDPNSDVAALRSGYASITPLKVDRTDREWLN